jgi:hypothetical protein
LGTDWYRMRLRPSAGDVDLPAAMPAGDDGGRRLAMAREWNRRVPAGQKVRLSGIPEFGEYPANALNSPWHTGCLTWIRRASEQGCGLLLDW